MIFMGNGNLDGIANRVSGEAYSKHFKAARSLELFVDRIREVLVGQA